MLMLMLMCLVMMLGDENGRERKKIKIHGGLYLHHIVSIHRKVTV